MIYLKGNVQIKITLRLEIKRGVGVIKESKKRTVVHLKEGVQDVGLASGLGGADFQCARKRQAKEVFVEGARLL